jgi:DNA-binding XRE family transcriptional regulator
VALPTPVKLPEWLASVGITVAELALTLNVSRAAVYAWIAGEYYPSGETLLMLAKLSRGIITIQSFPEIPLAKKVPDYLQDKIKK